MRRPIRAVLARLAAGLGLLAVLALAVLYIAAPARLLDLEFARRAALAGLDRETVQVADHRWSYYVGGEGPTLVLVHGFTGSKENWLDAARHLTPRFRVLIPDLPGWGDSERQADADYGVVPQAARLRAFLDVAGGGPVHLVGHSMGGHIAGLLAADHPAALRSLALVAPAGVPFALNDFTRRVLAGETPFNVADRDDWERLMQDLFVERPFLPLRLADVLIARNRDGHAFHAALLARMRGQAEALRLAAALPRLRTPTLVLWCREDRVLDVSSVAALRAGLPDAEITVFDGCGHMPMLERPAQTAQRLAAFAAAH